MLSPQLPLTYSAMATAIHSKNGLQWPAVFIYSRAEDFEYVKSIIKIFKEENYALVKGIVICEHLL